MKKYTKLLLFVFLLITVCILYCYLYQHYTKDITKKENGIINEYEVYSLNSIEINDIADFIKNKINTSFDINDYIVERIDNIIRLVYAPSNVKTNNIYTVILGSDKVDKIYSYLEDDFETLKKIISEKKKLSVSTEEQIKQELINDYNKEISIYQDGYRLKNHELVYYVLYDIKTGSISSSGLYEQIIK